MNTMIRKGLQGMVLSIILALTCSYTPAWGNEEEKKIEKKVEETAPEEKVEKKIQVKDTTPPVVSNVKVSDLTTTSVNISWETNEPARGDIIWGITKEVQDAYKARTWIMAKEFTTSHSFKITDLLPATLYYYWTAGVDKENNWVIPGPSTFTTLAK